MHINSIPNAASRITGAKDSVGGSGVGNAWVRNIGGAVDCSGECGVHNGDVNSGGFGNRRGQDSWGYGGNSSAVLGSAAAAAGVKVATRPSWWGCLRGEWCVA